MGAGHQKDQLWSLSLSDLQGVLSSVTWPMTQSLMPMDGNLSRNSAHQSSMAFLVGEHMMCYQGDVTDSTGRGHKSSMLGTIPDLTQCVFIWLLLVCIVRNKIVIISIVLS